MLGSPQAQMLGADRPQIRQPVESRRESLCHSRMEGWDCGMRTSRQTKLARVLKWFWSTLHHPDLHTRGPTFGGKPLERASERAIAPEDGTEGRAGAFLTRDPDSTEVQRANIGVQNLQSRSILITRCGKGTG